MKSSRAKETAHVAPVSQTTRNDFTNEDVPETCWISAEHAPMSDRSFALQFENWTNSSSPSRREVDPTSNIGKETISGPTGTVGSSHEYCGSSNFSFHEGGCSGTSHGYRSFGGRRGRSLMRACQAGNNRGPKCSTEHPRIRVTRLICTMTAVKTTNLAGNKHNLGMGGFRVGLMLFRRKRSRVCERR